MATTNAINANTAGIVGYNGTGTFTGTAATQYNVIVGGASSSTLANVAPSATTGVALISQGASANPAYGTVVVAGGGTGATTLTGVLIGNGTSAITANAVTQYTVLVGGASNAISSIGPGTAGQVLQSAGNAANPAYSTATYPLTTTVSQLLYSSATNVVEGLATGNDGVLITSHTGVPSWLAGGTTGQVLTATTNSPPTWATAAGGAGQLVLVQSQTASGSTTVIDFTTGTSTYNTHLLVWRNFVPATDDRFLQLQVSTNGGSSFVASGYTAGINYNAYNSATITNTSQTTAFLLSPSTSNTALNGASGFAYIYGANATTICYLVGECVVNRGAGTGTYFSYSGGNSATASVNAFRILLNGSGNISTGNFTLFGIKET